MDGFSSGRWWSWVFVWVVVFWFLGGCTASLQGGRITPMFKGLTEVFEASAGDTTILSGELIDEALAGKAVIVPSQPGSKTEWTTYYADGTVKSHLVKDPTLLWGPAFAAAGGYEQEKFDRDMQSFQAGSQFAMQLIQAAWNTGQPYLDQYVARQQEKNAEKDEQQSVLDKILQRLDALELQQAGAPE